MKKIIYLDNAATTKLCEEAKAEMEPYLSEEYGNASTGYELGEAAKAAITKARIRIADAIKASPDEIFFTSCGSEADNWAIKGIAGANKERGKHIITSQIEHHAVLNSCQYLSDLGYEVTYMKVDEQGRVDPYMLESAISESTTLISIMYANNEIGTIEPITEIGKIARKKGVFFHTDAVQAVGQIPIDVRQLPIDMLSASAHKFHGPKGVGFLYVKKGVKIPSFIHGGGQEQGKRAGTENVAGVVGMGKALELSCRNMQINQKYQRYLRNRLVEGIMREVDDVIYNGHDRYRLPGNVNISIKGIDAGTLLIMLDEVGICASAGSACNANAVAVSHVIEAIGIPDEYKKGTLRFSIGADNTEEEIDYTVQKLKEFVALLRSF